MLDAIDDEPLLLLTHTDTTPRVPRVRTLRDRKRSEAKNTLLMRTKAARHRSIIMQKRRVFKRLMHRIDEDDADGPVEIGTARGSPIPASTPTTALVAKHNGWWVITGFWRWLRGRIAW